MQVALRVVGGEDSRAVHPRAQLLEKDFSFGLACTWAKTCWSRCFVASVRNSALSAGRALNHLAEKGVGKADYRTSSLFWIQTTLFPLFSDSNGCRDAVLWKASMSLWSQSLHGREQTRNPWETRCQSESASGRDAFLHPSYGSSSGKRAATLAAVPACQKTQQRPLNVCWEGTGVLQVLW